MSENKTNNQRTIQDYDNQIRVGMKNLSVLKEERKRDCDHKPCGQGKVIKLHDTNINVPNKRDLPDSTFICTRCERYFEGKAYTQEECDSVLYMITSIFEQIKLNARLNGEDHDFLMRGYDSADVIADIFTYYNKMTARLSEGNGNNRNNNNRGQSKGHFGAAKSLYGGRGY